MVNKLGYFGVGGGMSSVGIRGFCGGGSISVGF